MMGRRFENVSNEVLLQDLRNYRRGSNYDVATMKAVSREVEYRKKKGMIRQSAKSSLTKTERMRKDMFKGILY